MSTLKRRGSFGPIIIMVMGPVLLVSLLAFWLFRPATHPTGRAPGNETADDTETAAVSPPRALPRVLVVQAPAPPTAEAPPRDEPPHPSPPLSDEAHLALDRHRAEQMETMFHTDAAPVAESAKMRADLVATFNDLAPRGVNVESIDCHYRLCRMTLMFDSLEADIEIMKDVFVHDQHTEWSKRGVMIPSREHLDNGKVRTTVYIPREGTIELVD